MVLIIIFTRRSIGKRTKIGAPFKTTANITRRCRKFTFNICTRRRRRIAHRQRLQPVNPLNNLLPEKVNLFFHLAATIGIGQASQNIQRLDAEMSEGESSCIGGGVLFGEVLEGVGEVADVAEAFEFLHGDDDGWE